LDPIAEPSMLCVELANILTWAATGSHRSVNGAQSMFANSGKHTLSWQTYSGDGGKAFGTQPREGNAPMILPGSRKKWAGAL
jgi:hypothetical protein